MKTSLFVRTVVLGFWFVSCNLALGQEPADELELRGDRKISGFVLEAELKAPDQSNKPKSYVVIETEAGGKLTLERGKVVSNVKLADDTHNKYREYVATLGSTPEDHWLAYEWCNKPENGGRSKYTKQIAYHLRQIVAADPNDTKAQHLLGNTEVNGRWVNEDQFFAAHGYVRDQSKWRPLLAVKVEQAGNVVDQARGNINESLRRWARDVAKKSDAQLSAQRPSVVADLMSITNPDTVALISEQFDKEKRNSVKEILLEAIASVDSRYAMGKTASIAVTFPEPHIRDRAVSLLKQPHFDPVMVVDNLSQYLQHSENPVVRQTALVIGEIAAHNGILPLIDAIRTKHKFVNPTAKPQGAIGGAFDNQGGGGLDVGGGGPAVIEREVENLEAIDALKKITKRDFGNDEAAWKSWFIETYSLIDVDVRADDD